MDPAAEARAKTPSSTPRSEEVEDVGAVVAALGPGVALFAIPSERLALQASARTSNLSRLVLYEPGGGGDGDPTNVPGRLKTLIAAGELVLVFWEVGGLSDAEINQVCLTPPLTPGPGTSP